MRVLALLLLAGTDELIVITLLLLSQRIHPLVCKMKESEYVVYVPWHRPTDLRMHILLVWSLMIFDWSLTFHACLLAHRTPQ